MRKSRYVLNDLSFPDHEKELQKGDCTEHAVHYNNSLMYIFPCMIWRMTHRRRETKEATDNASFKGSRKKELII